MVLVMAGIGVGLLLAGTIRVAPWIFFPLRQTKPQPAVFGPVVAAWLLVAFTCGPWLLGRVVMALVHLLA
jgi:hypothetical protein